MPKDVSSSSEEASDTEEVPQKRRKQASRYQCPADFVEFVHKPCASTLIERVRDDNTELWLIKAPNSFNPDSFSSLKMPLSGLQTVQAPAQQECGSGGNTGKIYSVLGGPSGAADLRLLTSHPQRLNSVVCAPAFSGLLNICESYGDCSTNQTTIAIPATPAPTVPPGLRQRFQPFGSRTPTLSRLMDTPDTPLPSSAETPLRVTLDPGEERKSKKKKKKEKRIKTEEDEEEMRMVRVKQELLGMTQSQEEPYELPGQEAELSEEKRKKKKKKKDKDRGEAEDTVDSSFNVIKKEVEVKVEPMDSSYGDIEDSGKKKKKIKKNKCGDD